MTEIAYVLYDDGHTGIFNADSLSDTAALDEASRVAGAGELKPGMFDVLVTNPPFGTKGKVTSKAILQSFLLAREWKADGDRRRPGSKLRKGGQTPEILFIERCLNLLKPGGRFAIVLPDGILTNSSLRYVRDFISDECDVIACVSLPDGTFKQAGVNPKTSVVFGVKKGGRGPVPAEVFMCELDKLGYDLVKKTAPVVFVRDESGDVVRDENGEPVPDSEVPEAIAQFADFKKTHGVSF